MIHKFEKLSEAYASDINGVIGVNADGTAYIETDDIPIEEIRAEKKRQVEEIRDYLYEQGVKIGDKWFQTSLWSKISFLAIAGGTKDYPGWKTLSGDAVVVTPVMAAQIIDATGVQMSLIHTNCEAHKTSIEKATDLYDYDISTGWPDVFR